MTLMTMLGNAQGGQLYSAVARSTDLPAAQCKAAMDRLCPAIAAQMKARAEADADLYDSLLDLLEDNGEGSPLDDAEALTGPEAVADGAEILNDIYGSRNAAIVEMRKLAPDVAETALEKLAAISATSVVAALAQSSAAPMALTGAQQAVSTGGIISILINSIIKGAIQTATRQLAPKRRRRSYTRYATRRRKRSSTARRRSSTTKALEDIFSEILGTNRK